MDLRRLRYFVAVAGELSFTRAAQRLHVSQPPLSQQLRALEEELGTRLFTRTSRRVELTEAGRAFLDRTTSILHQVERARQEVKEVAQGRSGTVHIGLTGSILLGEVPTALNAHRRDFPSVSTTLHEMAPVLQVAALIERRIDVSFSRTAPANEVLASELAWKEPVVVVLPAGHALARRKRIGLGDLRREDFVVLNPDSSPFARHLYDCCTEAGFAPRISQRVIESQSIPSLVAAGMGVALGPASIERGNHRQVVFCPLRGPAPAADVHMIYRKAESSPAVLAFLGTARTALGSVREKSAA